MSVRTLALVAGAAVALALPGGAGATTFCVPDFSKRCKPGKGRVAEPSLQTALTTKGNDGKADRIVLAPGMTTNHTPFQAGGFDSSKGRNVIRLKGLKAHA
ncbi:MAG TPA: hypothetical protein VIL04_00090 [Solirubrobacterales bacterium]